MWDEKGYLLPDEEKSKFRKILRETVVDPFKMKKASIPINKHIYKMTVKELRQELKKRDLKCSGLKKVLQNRLRRFFESDRCIKIQKERNEKLVKGYSKRLRNKERIVLPLCLENLIVTFFPTMTL